MSALSPKVSSEFIANNSKDVKINTEGVKQLAKLLSENLSRNEFNFESWHSHPVHPKEANPAAVDWIFLVDSLNFSFWSTEENKYKVNFQGVPYTGYLSLCAAINRALQDGIPICTAKYLSTITMDDVRHIFRSDSPPAEMPLLQERLEVMNNIGRTLIQEFRGSFTNCIEECKGSASQLMRLVVEKFPSYRDEALFKDQKVSFYKRAQILIADIWSCFGGKGLGAFEDIDTITIFADYRVPQVLLHYGVLEYSSSLLEKLQKDEELPNGSSPEVEIRGCTIWAVELIVNELNTLGCKKLNAVLVDYYLWDYRRLHEVDMEKYPYHKTRSIYY